MTWLWFWLNQRLVFALNNLIVLNVVENGCRLVVMACWLGRLTSILSLLLVNMLRFVLLDLDFGLYLYLASLFEVLPQPFLSVNALTRLLLLSLILLGVSRYILYAKTTLIVVYQAFSLLSLLHGGRTSDVVLVQHSIHSGSGLVPAKGCPLHFSPHASRNVLVLSLSDSTYLSWANTQLHLMHLRGRLTSVPLLTFVG